jgi:hypothetical protein
MWLGRMCGPALLLCARKSLIINSIITQDEIVLLNFKNAKDRGTHCVGDGGWSPFSRNSLGGPAAIQIKKRIVGEQWS